MPQLAKRKYCIGCMSCMDVCPRQAISIRREYSIPFPFVDTNACVDCQLCERVCPIVTPQRKNRVEDMRVYGGWAKDDKIRYNGASGGAFGGLAITFIKEHIGLSSVYGATLENNHVYHKRITTFEEVPILMNSKYIQSETVGIWKNIKDDLKQGYWVLFSGTPCQVAALYAYLGKERNHERLLTIEVVCHGVASQEALDIHLQHFHSKKIYSFRNKEEGQGWITSQCTTIERDGHSYRFIRKEDVFYKIFASWLLDRKSCSNCQYSSLNRVADITLADFWGGARDFREYELGVNVIVANNSKADTFVRGSKDLEVYGSTLYKAINSNSNFYNGYKYIQYHPFVLWANFSRKILPRRLWLQIAENRMPWKLFWAVYKVMTILHVKRRKKLIERQYGNILHEWLSRGVQY